MATQQPAWHMGDRVAVQTPSPAQTDGQHFLYGVSFNDSWNGTMSLNKSGEQGAAPQRNESLARVEIAVQAVILFLALVGNTLVLLVLLCRKKKMSRMKLLIVHLAVADLFVAFFNVLPQLIWDITFRFQGGDVLCKVVKFFQLVAMYSSSYVLVATAVDRYLVICHPLMTHAWTNTSVHLMGVVAWGCSLVFSLPQIFIFSYVETAPGSSIHECWATFDPPWTLQLYITWITATIYIIPFLFLTLTYSKICYIVWRSTALKQRSVKEVKFKKTRSYGSSSSSKQEYRRILSQPTRNGLGSRNGATSRTALRPRAHVHARTMAKSKIKTFKLTITVIVCYLLCWAPFFISQMWAAWDINAPFEGKAMVIIMLLASLNSCTNPWIYMAFTDNMCLCCRPRTSPRLKRGSTMDSSDVRTRTSVFSRAVDSAHEHRVAVPLVRLNSRGTPETHIG